MLKNTSTNYGVIAKSFHWLMAMLLIGMFIIAYIMINLPKSADIRLPLFDIHKATGLLLFSLVALRLAWRLINSPPVLPQSIPSWQRYAAKVNIALLYVLMFAMPVSGFFMSTMSGHRITFYGLFTIAPLANDKSVSSLFAGAHEYLSYLLIAFLSLHVIGAIYHHYFLKDDVLKRMWLRSN